MNEEELFCKLFPDYTVNGKPLSPYFDLFESGFEQAEKRITELEKEVERITVAYNNCAKDNYKKISELEKENAELKEVINNDVDKKIYVQLAKKAELADVQKEQLTKATELLKWFVWYFREDYNNVPYKHKVGEAEQFLSEVEK